MKRSWSTLLLLLSIALPAGSRAEELAAVQWQQKVGAQLPLDTVFRDEQGERRKLAHYFDGAPVILVFSYFRCPNLCSLVLNGLAKALTQVPEKLGRDYKIVTLSIDPHEKPELALMKKRSYLARLGETSRTPQAWTFLTGNEDEIRHLADAAGFRFRPDPATGEFSHPSGFLIATPKGAISKYFFGIQFNEVELNTSLASAREEGLGSLAHEVLLYCFHYDPLRNPHDRLIMRIIRITAITGVAALFTLLGYLFLSRGDLA